MARRIFAPTFHSGVANITSGVQVLAFGPINISELDTFNITIRNCSTTTIVFQLQRSPYKNDFWSKFNNDALSYDLSQIIAGAVKNIGSYATFGNERMWIRVMASATQTISASKISMVLHGGYS